MDPEERACGKNGPATILADEARPTGPTNDQGPGNGGDDKSCGLVSRRRQSTWPGVSRALAGPLSRSNQPDAFPEHSSDGCVKLYEPKVGARARSLRSGPARSAPPVGFMRKVREGNKCFANSWQALSCVPCPSFRSVSHEFATTATAGAAAQTLCTGVAPGSAVGFASPGLSFTGTASISAKSTTKTGTGRLSCVTGTKPPKSGALHKGKITSTSTTTCDNDTNTKPNPCPSGEFVYGSIAQLVAGAGTLQQSDKKTSWTVGSTTYVTKNTANPAAGTGTGPGNCPSGEVGFVLTGKLTAPATQAGKSTEVTACLNTDTGPGTTGSFLADLTTAGGGDQSITIATASLDPATSTIEFA